MLIDIIIIDIISSIDIISIDWVRRCAVAGSAAADIDCHLVEFSATSRVLGQQRFRGL